MLGRNQSTWVIGTPMTSTVNTYSERPPYHSYTVAQSATVR